MSKNILEDKIRTIATRIRSQTGNTDSENSINELTQMILDFAPKSSFGLKTVSNLTGTQWSISLDNPIPSGKDFVIAVMIHGVNGGNYGDFSRIPSFAMGQLTNPTLFQMVSKHNRLSFTSITNSSFSLSYNDDITTSWDIPPYTIYYVACVL